MNFRVTKYPEGNIEALLRGRIQKLVNTHFIFAGSEQRLMNEMFFSDKRNAIAADRCVSRITSSEFVKRHHLKSASAVQSATKRLLDLDLITEHHKSYSISDPLLRIWIVR